MSKRPMRGFRLDAEIGKRLDERAASLGISPGQLMEELVCAGLGTDPPSPRQRLGRSTALELKKRLSRAVFAATEDWLNEKSFRNPE